MIIEKHVLGPIPIPSNENFDVAELEFYGINHFRPSYSARVFFNDKKVSKAVCDIDRESYAGGFSIFGHATCAGDAGHCCVPSTQRRFDTRPSHPLTKAFKRIDISQALMRVIEEGAKELTVTILASCEEDEFEGKHLLDLQGVQLVTHDYCKSANY